MEPHFQTSAAKSMLLEGTKTAAPLPHCRECAKEWRISGSTLQLELKQNYEMSSNKQNEGRGASSRGFVRRIGVFFGGGVVGDATQVLRFHL